MSHLQGAYFLKGMGGESNERNINIDISFKNEGMNCRMVEVVKCSTPKYLVTWKVWRRLVMRIYKSRVNTAGCERKTHKK